ncbi:MAG TPA: RHS repeat-associated core domain-containing protein [Candidatus Omnitrophota bacterium]|nr:RHS repeat-associated core domain-containing protein [Candidatus Omnitrophota bacterium]
MFHLRGADTQLQSADFNGDGIVDFVAYNLFGNEEFAYSNGIPGDLLTGVDNTIGGKTRISYVPSTAYNNTYLPFVIPLVSSVETSNSRDHALMLKYSYEGGLWKPQDREFYGFRKVRVTDPAGRFTETIFLQDDYYLRGRAASQTSYQPDGRRVGEKLSTWEVKPLFSDERIPVRLPCLTWERDRVYGIDGIEGIELKTWNTYTVNAQYGTAYQSFRWFMGAQDLKGYSNEIDNSKYSLQQETQVAGNYSDDVWIVNLTRQKRQSGFGYESREEYLYDGANYSNALPSRGMLTQKNILDPNNISVKLQTVKYDYDSYGNLVAETDPEGNRSRLEFDGRYHMLPVKAINALGQFSKKEYFGVGENGFENDDGAWGPAGSLAAETDANGARVRYSYDSLGRLLKVAGPDDSIAVPTEAYAYQFRSDHTAVFHSLRRQSGQAQTIDSVRFFDGLGTPILSKTQSGKPGRYILSGQKTRDGLGRVEKEFHPRDVSSELGVLDQINEEFAHARYEYDERDRPIEQYNFDGTRQSWGYALLPRKAESVVSEIDANGHKKISYSDALGRVVRIEDYAGADGRFHRYPQKNYELYALTRYEYDGLGRLLSVRDAQNNSTVIAYDKLGRKTVMDDPDMGRWEYGYDNNGNLKWQVDAQGRRVDFAYDALNRLVNKTDGDEIDVVYTYDRQDLPYSQGRLGLVEYGPMGDGDWTEFQYDRFGREVRSQKTIDGQPYQIQRIYDSMGNLIGVIYPDGTAVYYHFNEAGQLDGVANDPELFDDAAASSGWLSSSREFWRWVGRMASCLFGVKEAHAQETYREASIISPQPGSTISSLPLSISWDPGLNVSHYYFYIGSTRGGSDIYSAYLYGSRLDLSDVQLKGGPVYFRLWSYIAYQGWKYKDYEYQSIPLGAASAPAEISSPVPGSVVSSSPLQISWSPGVRVSGYYLYIGSSPGAADLYVKYFPNNGVRTVSVNVPINGASLHVRLWSYLSEGRWEFKDYTFSTTGNQTIVPAKMISPAPGTLISQDQAGFQWDKGEGVLQYWIYLGAQQGGADILNRNMDLATSVTASVPRTGRPLYVRLWSRTSLGWKYFDYQYLTRSPNQKPVVAITGATVLNGTPLDLSVIATDEDGDRLEFLRPEAGDLPLGCDFKIVSSSEGRLEGRLSWSPTAVQQGDYTIPVEVKDPDEAVSKMIEIQVVAGMRMEEPKVYISDIQYTALGQIERILYGNGVSTIYEYDPLNFRLTRVITADADGKVLQDLFYEYDAVGNMVVIRDGVRHATQYFEYDHLNRLVLASHDATYGTQTYGYDRVGNILEKGGVSYRYAESGSRVGGAAAGPHAVTSLGNGTVFQYDANGNMIRKERSGVVSSFEFDAEGRLRQVFRNGEQEVRFAYDGDGGRVKKIVYGALSGGGVSTMSFPELLEGNGGEQDLVTHFVGQLFEKTNVDLTKHIFAGERRIASVKNGEVAFIHPDHLGSANLVTDHAGSVSELIEYQPFGSFSRHERFGRAENGSAYFTGQRLDDETGLYYYKSRYYDPDLGRFISADTVVPSAGDPQAFNRYAYVRNNPVVLVDPDGHGWFIAAIIGALIGGISGGVMAYNNDQSAWKGAFWGGLQGFLSGAALGTPFSSIEKQGYWWGLTRISGGLSLGGQVAGAAGWSDGQQALNYAAMGTAGLYAGANVLKGIKDWAYENRFRFVRKDSTGDFVQSGEHVFINGITTPLETQGRLEGALEQAWRNGAEVLAYNPSSGPIADLIEAGLGKFTFTSSVSRQISNRLIGLKGIHLAGFSQGGIIASNVALNLGLRDQRNVLSSLTVGSSQVSQIRTFVSGAIGGLNSRHVLYKTGMWDFSGFLAPNLNPKHFLGGAVGTAVLPVGIQNHYWPY